MSAMRTASRLNSSLCIAAISSLLDGAYRSQKTGTKPVRVHLLPRASGYAHRPSGHGKSNQNRVELAPLAREGAAHRIMACCLRQAHDSDALLRSGTLLGLALAAPHSSAMGSAPVDRAKVM